ncbi:hypothetical protein A5643_01415 [Mycobacterium sp. 1274756.6]|nr:hypothetical protein A5643_01415 [Mycobacterium sp. 1274756.6]
MAIRAQRLALAMLNGATDATSEIATELGGCLDCIARLAATYLGGYAAALSAYAGSPENAAAAIQQGLMRDLDNGNRCGT